MEKEIATTYKEYKNGAPLVAGFGRLGCYQGLDYLKSLLDTDRYYSERLEDSIIFIVSYINSVETQLKKQKEINKKAVEYIKDFLCTEEYIKVDGYAIANNYEKLLKILEVKGVYYG